MPPKGIRLSNPAAQRREESLRAVDRALRIGVKVQALAVWTAEGLNTLLSPSSLPTEVRERAEILFRGLSGLIDAGVDQLSRASARVSHERRENILPFMGLSAATQADLRRLPVEGPDLFAGHFQEVLVRQADRQDNFRKNRKLLTKGSSTPAVVTGGTVARRRAPKPGRGRGGSFRSRGGGANRGRAPATLSRAPDTPAETPRWSGKVQVSGSGRSFPKNSGRGSRGKQKPF